jgi:hypothetical protein
MLNILFYWSNRGTILKYITQQRDITSRMLKAWFVHGGEIKTITFSICREHNTSSDQSELSIMIYDR